MHLSPTAEQQALKDAVRRFCAEQVTPERLAAWEKAPSGVDAECWHAIAALGWFGLGLPVAASGSGADLVDVACLVEECARGLIPRPVINAIRGGLVMTRLAHQSQYLSAVARGETVVTLAVDEQHTRLPARYRTQLSGSDAPRLSGEKWYVADAARADLHVVAAREGGGVSLVLVSRDHAQIETLRTFDGEHQAVVRYEQAPVQQRLSLPGGGAQSLTAIQAEQTALALAEMIGGMDAALSMTVEYVKQREQFGQKIAVFQAVQHQVADMATALTAARHLTWQAITRLAAGSSEGSELAMAAVFVGQAFKRVTLAAHHLHGGAGYVIEHPLHYHAERAQALCIRYTPEAAALDHVAAALLGGGES